MDSPGKGNPSSSFPKFGGNLPCEKTALLPSQRRSLRTAGRKRDSGEETGKVLLTHGERQCQLFPKEGKGKKRGGKTVRRGEGSRCRKEKVLAEDDRCQNKRYAISP